MFNFTINLVESRHLFPHSVLCGSPGPLNFPPPLHPTPPPPTVPSITVHERALALFRRLRLPLCHIINVVSFVPWCCIPSVKLLSGHIRSALPAQTFHNPPTLFLSLFCATKQVGNHSHFFPSLKPPLLCYCSLLPTSSPPHLSPKPFPPHLSPPASPTSQLLVAMRRCAGGAVVMAR